MKILYGSYPVAMFKHLTFYNSLTETHRKWIDSLFVFLFIFLLCYPTIPYGLDLTDHGFFLTNHDLANHLGIQHVKVASVWWFSDVVGGWWLKITDGYGAWGARLGQVILISLNGMLATRILLQVFKPSASLIFVMTVSGLFSRPMLTNILSYDTVPVLFFLFFGLFFIKLNDDPSKLLYQILAGLSLFFLILSRWALATVFCIPLLSLLASLYFKKIQIKAIFISYIKMVATVLLLFVLFGTYLWSQNQLHNYIFFTRPSGIYNLSNLFTIYKSQLTGKNSVLHFTFWGPIFFLPFLEKI